MSASTKEIRGVLAYVPSVARRYLGCGLDFDDLVAAGNLGLVEAGLRFDPSRNVKLVTYADWWIRKAIVEALAAQIGPVRIPRYQQEKLKQLRAARAEWIAREGTEPNQEQLGRVAGLDRSETERLTQIASRSVSLDQPARPGDRGSIGDLISDADQENPQQSLVQRDLAERLHGHVAALPARERAVLTLRFGLADKAPLTLREAGELLAVSRERVRQIEIRALLRLRGQILNHHILPK